MTKYSDEEVDVVALAIARGAGCTHADTLVQIAGIELWRSLARAALAARDALFEVVGERWEVRVDGEVDHYGSDPDAMHKHARMIRSRDGLTDEECKVIHVTTKRRKR